jgi:regulator of protease activity HflC (stomatin/prohibitin superfamily)
MEATQKALESRNRVAQVQAEAEQAITQAHGGAEAARQKAQGDADALLIRARAEAQANEIIRLSTTPAVLQYRAIEHWDGKLPTYSSGQLPLLTFDLGKVGAGMDEGARERELRRLLSEVGPSVAPSPGETPPQDAKDSKPAPAPPAPAH